MADDRRDRDFEHRSFVPKPGSGVGGSVQPKVPAPAPTDQLPPTPPPAKDS